MGSELDDFLKLMPVTLVSGAVAAFVTMIFSNHLSNLKYRMEVTEKFLHMSIQSQSSWRKRFATPISESEQIASIGIMTTMGRDFRFLRRPAISTLLVLKEIFKSTPKTLDVINRSLDSLKEDVRSPKLWLSLSSLVQTRNSRNLIAGVVLGIMAVLSCLYFIDDDVRAYFYDSMPFLLSILIGVVIGYGTLSVATKDARMKHRIDGTEYFLDLVAHADGYTIWNRKSDQRTLLSVSRVTAVVLIGELGKDFPFLLEPARACLEDLQDRYPSERHLPQILAIRKEATVALSLLPMAVVRD